MAWVRVQQQQMLSIVIQLLFPYEFNQFFTHFCKQLCLDVPSLWVSYQPSWWGSISGFCLHLGAFEDNHWGHSHASSRYKGQQCHADWFFTWNCLWALLSLNSNNLLLWDVRNSGFVNIPYVIWLVVEFKLLQQLLVEPEEFCNLECICTGCSVKWQVFGIFLLEVRPPYKKSFQPPGPCHLLNRTKTLSFVGHSKFICQLSKVQISEGESMSWIKYHCVIQVLLLL